MRLSKPFDFTYKGHLQNVYYNKEQTDETEIPAFLEKFKEVNQFSIASLPAFFVLDYSSASYKLVTQSLNSFIGYDIKEFMESGLGMVMDIFHADDFRLYNEKVFTSNLLCLKNTPQCDHSKYVFSYTYRVKTTKGKYKYLLQRNSYITSKETNLPVYSLGMVIDVTNIKTDTVMLHTIDKNDFINEFKTVNLETNYFYPNEEDALLTAQEKNVLKWIAEGLSSKQLADKLFVSEHTVSS